MEKRKFVCNEAGVCPICGSFHLSWGDSDYTSDYLKYEWICEDCNAEGCEWYKLIFDGHEVNNPDTNENEDVVLNYEDANEQIKSN